MQKPLLDGAEVSATPGRDPAASIVPLPGQPADRLSGLRVHPAEQLIAAIAVVAILVALPWLGLGYRFLSLAFTTGYTAIALYGLAIQFGQAGIMSVGHAAVMGIGAYTAAILARDAGFGFWLALPF